VARHLRTDATYHLVLRSAAGLVAQRGYLGTSVNDLLERAGLTKNAFYSYFPSKEALAVALVEQTAAQWPPLITAFKSLRAPALDTVIALSFEVADRYANDDVVRAGIRLSLERDTIRTPLPPPFHGWVDEIEGLLSPAGEWELMGLSAPAEVAARVIVTCLIGAQYLSAGPDGGKDLARRLTEIWTVILPGLRPTPDPAGRIASGQALRERARAAAATMTSLTTLLPVLPRKPEA
jgi:AcrR family transcriptional regulator